MPNFSQAVISCIHSSSLELWQSVTHISRLDKTVQYPESCDTSHNSKSSPRINYPRFQLILFIFILSKLWLHTLSFFPSKVPPPKQISKLKYRYRKSSYMQSDPKYECVPPCVGLSRNQTRNVLDWSWSVRESAQRAHGDTSSRESKQSGIASLFSHNWKKACSRIRR